MQQSMAMLSMQITFSLLHPPSFLPKSGPGAGPDSRACKILSASSILLYFCPNWVRESRQDWTSEIRPGPGRTPKTLVRLTSTRDHGYQSLSLFNQAKKTIEHCIQKNLAFVTEVSIFSENVHSCVHFRIPMRVSVAKRKNILYTRVNSCFFCLIALGNDVLLHSYTTNICYRTYKIKLKMYTAVYIFNYYN